MKYLFLTGISLVAATPALAQDYAIESGAERVRNEEITVIATGSWQRIKDVGQSISVAGADEIAAVQGADLTRVLERLPGVALTRNGGLGAQTGVFVRGANADQLLVMVDGVRVADYASPGGGYDMGNLLSGDLAKVELLRGSNSVAWGSQAIGGVLAVTTQELDGVSASSEYGADNTTLANAGAGFAGSGGAASVSAGYARTDGFSALRGGTEADGYRQWHVSGKGRLTPSDELTLSAVGRYADSRLDLDMSGPDSLETQKTREGTGRLSFDYQPGGFTLRGGVDYGAVRRDYQTAYGPSRFTGGAWRADLAGNVELGRALTLDFGADGEWQHAQSSFDPRATSRMMSGHLLLGWRGPVTLAAGVRIDDHSRFGTHATLGANGSLELGAGWRARASYGEGYKAPTLYQLFGGYVGNPDLQPERSRSFDFGLEHGVRGVGMHFAATAFRRDSRDLIDLDSNFVYHNVARARAQGFELEAGVRPSERWLLQVAYTYLEANDRTQHRALSRRPHNVLSFAADWTTPLAGLELGGDVRMASDAVEYDYAGVAGQLDGYAVADARARLPLTEAFELYGRIENVTDERYETAAGFATPGRSVYFGARARF